jgi:hypothetical protein
MEETWVSQAVQLVCQKLATKKSMTSQNLHTYIINFLNSILKYLLHQNFFKK